MPWRIPRGYAESYAEAMKPLFTHCDQKLDSMQVVKLLLAPLMESLCRQLFHQMHVVA